MQSLLFQQHTPSFCCLIFRFEYRRFPIGINSDRKLILWIEPLSLSISYILFPADPTSIRRPMIANNIHLLDSFFKRKKTSSSLFFCFIISLTCRSFIVHHTHRIVHSTHALICSDYAMRVMHSRTHCPSCDEWCV